MSQTQKHTTRPRDIINPYTFTPRSGRELTLGLCSACGRKLWAHRANRTGARCHYCGAQYDRAGVGVDYHGRGWKLTHETGLELDCCKGKGHTGGE